MGDKMVGGELGRWKGWEMVVQGQGERTSEDENY